MLCLPGNPDCLRGSSAGSGALVVRRVVVVGRLVVVRLVVRLVAGLLVVAGLDNSLLSSGLM